MSVIRASALTGFHELVTELGGDSQLLLDGAHIRRADLGRTDRFISLPNGTRMLEAAAAGLETPDFGRRLAQRQGIEILGPVGLAARNAATVAEAFIIIDKFMPAYCPAISARMTTHLDPDLYRFEFEYLIDPAPPQAQAIELSLGVTLRVLQLFLGRAYRPVAVQLPHPALGPVRDYQRYFGCPPGFCEPVAGFTLRGVDLQRPLPTDPLAHQTAVSYLADTVGEVTPATSHLVRSLVRQLLATRSVGQAEIARHIGIHPKSLQRRLAAEGTTFAALVDRTRRDAAQRLLLDTDLGLDQICRQLGYAEQSVLTRSCRRWFAMTPTAYRNTGRPPDRHPPGAPRR